MTPWYQEATLSTTMTARTGWCTLHTCRPMPKSCPRPTLRVSSPRPCLVFPAFPYATPPGSLSTSDISQFQPHFARMAPVGLMPAHSIQAYPQQPMFAPAPEHVGMPLVGSPPASPHVYDPLSPPVSGSETSGELYHSRGSSGAATPDLGSRRNSVSSNRSAHRYNPTPSPSTSSGGRSRARSLSDDDTMGIAETIASTRKEVTRKQRIEAEQRRRDELRDGYAKLKVFHRCHSSQSFLQCLTASPGCFARQQRKE